MKKRRGASIVELIMIMSACTVGMALTGVLLQRAMRIQMLSRAHVDVERTSLRLSKQFRKDVHRARAANSAQADRDENVFLRLEFANGESAEYSRQNGNVLRRGSRTGGKSSREEYDFPAIDEVKIETATEPQRLVLTVIKSPSEPTSSDADHAKSTRVVPVSIRAEAVVGRDLRFGDVPAIQEAPE